MLKLFVVDVKTKSIILKNISMTFLKKLWKKWLERISKAIIINNSKK